MLAYVSSTRTLPGRADCTTFTTISINVTIIPINIYDCIFFSSGVEFSDPDIKALRGVEVKATPSWEGDKLVLKGSGGNGTATREIVGGQLVMSFDIMGTKATRFFNKA